MPLYEYQCDSCCHAFEYLVMGEDHEPTNCPECGENKLTRLMSCASFLGGSGDGVCAPSTSSGFS